MSEIDEVDQRSGLVLHFELDHKQNILMFISTPAGLKKTKVDFRDILGKIPMWGSICFRLAWCGLIWFDLA